MGCWEHGPPRFWVQAPRSGFCTTAHPSQLSDRRLLPYLALKLLLGRGPGCRKGQLKDQSCTVAALSETGPHTKAWWVIKDLATITSAGLVDGGSKYDKT